MKFSARIKSWLSGTRPKVSVYSDGSSHDVAHRPGGWAFVVVRDGEVLLEDSGGQPSASNNTMELHAALAGLNAVIKNGWHRDATVELVSDSRETLSFASGERKPRGADSELATALRNACVTSGASTRWVRGHSGDELNDRVDALASAAKAKFVPLKARKNAERKRRLNGQGRRG